MRVTLIGAIVSSIIFGAVMLPGCDKNGGGGGGGGSGVLTRADLVGTWSSTDAGSNESYEFRNDGTFTTSGTGEDGPYSADGTWSVDGGVVTVVMQGSESDDGFTYTWEETISFRAAVVSNVLYLFITYRTGGTGSGIDGTWEYRENDEASVNGTGPEGAFSEEGGEEYLETTTIRGTTFESNYSIHEWGEDEEGPYDDRETGRVSGTLRIQGDNVFATITAVDGTAVPAGDQEEMLWGYRAAPNVLVNAWDETPLSAMGYRRQ